MPRPRRNEKHTCRYYTWMLSRRDGVWQADGRANRPGLGRHSLGTKDAAEAKQLLAQLDLTLAVKHGVADPAALRPREGEPLSLAKGRALYMDYVGRSRVAGGIRPSSVKRYRAVFDKFLAFAEQKGVTTWNCVETSLLVGYTKHLELKGYAYRTQYLELTTLKQTVLFLVKRGLLSADRRIELPLVKADGTDTYCWRDEEVRAMIEHCRARGELRWLGDVILALATTGLRISELAGLRWSDIDLATGMVKLVDETTTGRHRSKDRERPRTLKSGRGRSFPIQEELLPILRGMTRHPDGLVFHGQRRGRLKPDVVRVALIRDVLAPLSARFPTPADEVGFAQGRPHSFRHFFCSMCANRGVSQRVVMRWLGHKDSRMVEHYYHLHDDEARRQMGRIRLFEEEAGDSVVVSE